MTNVDESKEHFALEPKEQFAVAKRMRAVEERMLAVYHSHPETPARPSEEDIRLAYQPDVVYLIISLASPVGPDLRGFWIRDGAVEPAEVEVLP